MLHWNSMLDDPTELLRDVDCHSVAALIPFYKVSDEGLNPLPQCAWVCSALPGSVHDFPEGDPSMERCMLAATLRYLMRGAFGLSEECKNLPIIGNDISLETVMRGLHKLATETSFDTVSVRRTPAELKMQIDEFLMNASEDIQELFEVSDISSFTPVTSVFLGSEAGYGLIYHDPLCVPIEVLKALTYGTLLEPGENMLGPSSGLIDLLGDLLVKNNIENRVEGSGSAMIALQTALGFFARDEPHLATMAHLGFRMRAFWDWVRLRIDALGLPLDDSGALLHANLVPSRLMMRLGWAVDTELKKQSYMARLLLQVLKFYPLMDHLFRTTTVPDAIKLILKLGSELSWPKTKITYVSSLTTLEEVEAGLSKFEAQIVTFLANEQGDRHVAARCVEMIIKLSDDFHFARTVSERNTGSGDKDVLTATSSLVSYLNSPVVQELSHYVMSRIMPSYNVEDGTVTEAATKADVFMMFMGAQHGILSRYMTGGQSFSADTIAGSPLLTAGASVRLQSTAWNNTETPEVINEALSALVLPQHLLECGDGGVSVFHNYRFDKKQVEPLLKGKDWDSLNWEETFLHRLKACEAEITLAIFYQNKQIGGKENSVSFTSCDSMKKLAEVLAPVFEHLLGYQGSGEFSFGYVMEFAITALELAERRPNHALDIKMAVHEMMKQVFREAGDQFANYLGRREILLSVFPPTWVPSTTTAFRPLLALLDEAKKASVSARLAPMFTQELFSKRPDPKEGDPSLLLKCY